MTIIDEVREITRLSKQTRAVAKYLEEHGSLDNITAIREGLPEVGYILRLGARVHELRQEGDEIATDMHGGNTTYRLISKPAPKQLSLISR